MTYKHSEAVESIFSNPSYTSSIDILASKIHLVKTQDDYQKLARSLACDNKTLLLRYLIEKDYFSLKLEDLLQCSASVGALETTQYLIQIGVDPTSNNYDSLGWAVSNGHFSVVKYIIETGVNIQEKNDLLITAIGEGHHNIAYLLLDNNVYYNPEDILNIRHVYQTTKDKFIQYAQYIENKKQLHKNLNSDLSNTSTDILRATYKPKL